MIQPTYLRLNIPVLVPGRKRKTIEVPVSIRLFSPIEAADYLGGPGGAISVQTLNRWRATGWIRALQIGSGSGYVYTMEALNECLRLRNLEGRIHTLPQATTEEVKHG